MKQAAIAILLLLSAPAIFAADTYVSDQAHSEATFQVRHLVSTVTGRFDTFDATVVMDKKNPAASSVKFTIDAKSINTNVAKRDDHLRSDDFFAVEQYPQITFVSSKIKPRGKNLYDVTGTLTMRGVSKQITLPVTYLGTVKDPWGNERVGFSTETTLNRQDYGIKWNKSLDEGGYLLSDDVKIRINIEAVAKK